MADTLNKMDEVELYAIASRDIDKAKAFADEFKVQKSYGSYEDLVKDEVVELVYIATPHSHHYEHGKLCLENKKHVLCEKAFTANSEQAKLLTLLAKEENLLLAEAIWPRYMPSRSIIDEVIKSGIIGDVTLLTANLGYVIYQNERIQNLDLAGGALLDITIYPINFMLMHLGKDISKINAVTAKSETGVDTINNITVFYKNGAVATLSSNVYSVTDRRGMIYGTKGYIEVTNVNNPELVEVFDNNRELVARHEIPKQISGYEYEVKAAIEAIKQGKIQCEAMPHEESIFMMEFMDEVRKQWGIKFPFEN